MEGEYMDVDLTKLQGPYMGTAGAMSDEVDAELLTSRFSVDDIALDLEEELW
jgi:hypothetical protein